MWSHLAKLAWITPASKECSVSKLLNIHENATRNQEVEFSIVFDAINTGRFLIFAG